MRIPSVLLVLAILADPAIAEIYKCTDEGGHVSFGDTPCADGQQGGHYALDLPAHSEAAASASSAETQRRVSDALAVLQPPVRPEQAAAPVQPVIVPPQVIGSPEDPAVATPYYLARPPYYRQRPHHGQPDNRHRAGLLDPDHPSKNNPNWALHLPDNSYRARQEAARRPGSDRNRDIDNQDDPGVHP